MGSLLSRRERELLAVVECQGDHVDVVAAAQDLGISQSTFKTRVKAIRQKLAAPSATMWLEDLPGVAKQRGERLPPCGPDHMPDDGNVRIDSTTVDV